MYALNHCPSVPLSSLSSSGFISRSDFNIRFSVSEIQYAPSRVERRICKCIAISPSEQTAYKTSVSRNENLAKLQAGYVIPEVLFGCGISPVSLTPSVGLASRVPCRRGHQVVRMAPQRQSVTRRSPGDFPVEWERSGPARRPDIFPQFSPMKTPLPPPMPSDPPPEEEWVEEDEEWEEEGYPEEGEQPDGS